MDHPFQPALPHGELVEVHPDIFMVTGTVKMGPMRFSRNMTVVREGDRLVIVNSVRLNDAGLQKLDSLGRVTDAVRIGGFHGMDDPFYKDRYGAKVWSVVGQRWVKGFNYNDDKIPHYFKGDAILGKDGMPLAGASLYRFDCNPPEALLCLPRDGGIVISGDALQNWAQPDLNFNFLGTLTMRMMGFFKPCNVGPGWLKQAKPSTKSLRGVLDLEFEHVLPAHGVAVKGGAKARFSAAINRASAAAG